MDKDATLGDSLGHARIENESERLGFDTATTLGDLLDHVEKFGLLRRKLDAESDHHRLTAVRTFGHRMTPIAMQPRTKKTTRKNAAIASVSPTAPILSLT